MSKELQLITTSDNGGAAGSPIAPDPGATDAEAEVKQASADTTEVRNVLPWPSFIKTAKPVS